MHMFFVAFNHRQNLIVSKLEKTDNTKKANDVDNLIYINKDGEMPQKDEDAPYKDKDSLIRREKANWKDVPEVKHNYDDLKDKPITVVALK